MKEFVARSDLLPTYHRFKVCVVVLSAMASVAAAQDSLPVEVPQRDDQVDFQTDIFPILKANCLACHNSSAAEGDLILESPETMRQGGLSGPAIVDGSSEESLLFQAASHRGDIIMPPDANAAGAENLTPEQLGLLKLWIEQGAQGNANADGADLGWQSLPADLHPIYALAVTSHGRYVAAGRGDRLFVYQFPTRQLLAELVDPSLAALEGDKQNARPAAHLDLVQSLDFSPDGRRLASGGFRTIKIWKRIVPTVVHSSRATSEALENRDRVEEPPSLKWHDNIVQISPEAADGAARSFDVGRPVSSAALSPDGTRVLVLASTGPATLWDAQSGQHIADLAGQLSLRDRVADAERLVRIRERQRELAQRDLDAARQRKQQAEEALKQAQTEVEAAEKAAADVKEAGAERDSAESAVKAAREALERNAPIVDRAATEVQTVETALEQAVQEIATATTELDELRQQLVEDSSFSGAAFSPDGEEIAVVDASGELLTFSAAEGVPLEHIDLNQRGRRVLSVQYVDKRRVQLATAQIVYEINTLPKWELEQTIGAIDDPDLLADRVTSVDFSTDGGHLAAGSGEPSRSGRILVFDVTTGAVVQSILDAHSDTVLALEFAPDGERLLSGGADRFARLFNTCTGTLERTLEGHSGHVTGLAWHPDARTVATASADGAVKLWDTLTGEQQKTIQVVDSPLTDVSFLGTDDVLVITGGKQLVVSRKTDGSAGPGYGGAASFVHAVATTVDGEVIFAGDESGQLRVWRKDGKEVGVLSP